MRAERDRRATILHTEGVKQSQILTAQGDQQSAVLRAQGEREAAILRAEGEARAIQTVFQAIHDGRPDRELLSYQYLQMLPRLADGQASKVFVIPSEFTQALGGIGATIGNAVNGMPPKPPTPPADPAPRDDAPRPDGPRALPEPPRPTDPPAA